MRRKLRVFVFVVAVAVSGVVSSVQVNGVAVESDMLLVTAARASDVTEVRRLIDQGVDVNQAESDGATALHWASHQNDPEVVKLLLNAGAAVAAMNRYGVQPLSLAAENGNAVILELLLEAGADPNASLLEGETALMTAARTGDADSIRVLLVYGADPNARDSYRGQTALMWAAARNHAAAIHTLAELGADIHATTNTEAASPNGPRMFYASNPTGFTALTFAARAGSIDALRVLLEAGANINDQLSDGQSALIVAVANANWTLANYMVDRGADPNLAGAGWNAIHQLVRTRRMNTGFGFPGPIPTGHTDSVDVLRKMIAVGGDVNARMTVNGMKDGQRNRLNRLGATSFFLAAKVTDTEAMRVLVDAGADATIPSADGTTPLMVAAGVAIWNPGEDGGSLPGQEDEVLEAVKMCVVLGNAVNAGNYRGETPLHGAAFRGANNVVEYLVAQGADLDARTVDGYSPLAIADGFSYSDFYKAQKHTAVQLRQLMTARGISTDGEGHVVPGSVCYDCLQTRADQIELWTKWEEELASEYKRKNSGEQEQ
jgi:ankyrin repeat protein